MEETIFVPEIKGAPTSMMHVSLNSRSCIAKNWVERNFTGNLGDMRSDRTNGGHWFLSGPLVVQYRNKHTVEKSQGGAAPQLKTS